MIRKYNTVYINELGMSKELSEQADIRVTTTRTIVLSLKWEKKRDRNRKKNNNNKHTHTQFLSLITEANTP